MVFNHMVSIVASIHNEEKALSEFITRVVKTMDSTQFEWELLLVDDRSTDKSPAIIDQFVSRDRRLRAFHHDRRGGQKATFMTGFRQARGSTIVLMDSDLQVIPEELPILLDKMTADGLEIVCTYNDIARGGKRRSLVSRMGNVFLRLLFHLPVQDAGANFMAIKREFVSDLTLIANDQRYLLPITMSRGLTKIGEVGLRFEKRQWGKSKYSKLKKLIQGVPEQVALWYRIRKGYYRPKRSGNTGDAILPHRKD